MDDLCGSTKIDPKKRNSVKKRKSQMSVDNVTEIWRFPLKIFLKITADIEYLLSNTLVIIKVFNIEHNNVIGRLLKTLTLS